MLNYQTHTHTLARKELNNEQNSSFDIWPKHTIYCCKINEKRLQFRQKAFSITVYR